MRQIPLWGPSEPPSLRAVTALLRQLNSLFAHELAVSITPRGIVAGRIDGPPSVGLPYGAERLQEMRYGREILPGSSQKFDAVRTARRLIAALADLESA